MIGSIAWRRFNRRFNRRFVTYRLCPERVHVKFLVNLLLVDRSTF